MPKAVTFQIHSKANAPEVLLNDFYNAHVSMISKLERLGSQEDKKVEDAIKDVLEELKHSENVIKDALKTVTRSDINN